MKIVFKNNLQRHALPLLLFSACGGAPLETVTEDPTDVPIVAVTKNDLATFNRGDLLIEESFRDTQGLGPYYIRSSCRSCHAADSRGPGSVQRMAIVEADGFTRSADQSALPFGGVVRPLFTAGATVALTAPTDAPGLKLSLRVGPALFARGYMEAVDAAAIEAQAALEQQVGHVSGRPNYLTDGSIGRFGVKGRVGDLQTFTADAFHGDMGLTSDIFPNEFPNPAGLTDDLKAGVDLPMQTIDDIAGYIRVLAMPKRSGLTDGGKKLFAQVGCVDCHTPSLKTRADFKVAALAGIDAEIYSDLLLHDMGTQLADGIIDFMASEREWKTAPLMGMRHLKTFMHDARARSITEAVMAHQGDGSEANASIDQFMQLSRADQTSLIDFVSKL